MTDSNANTSGLGDVGLSETYRFAYESIRNGAPGLSDATCAAIARSINMKVSLAANDRATAAEARADRLAKALEEIRDEIESQRDAITHPYGRRAHFIDSTDQIRVDQLTALLDNAALQQETQP